MKPGAPTPPDEIEHGTAFEPAGLVAAGEKLDAEAAAAEQADRDERDPGSGGADEGPSFAWPEAFEMLFEVIFGRLAARDDLWKLSDSELRSLGKAWGAVAEHYVKAPGIWGGAILATAGVVVPRMMLSRMRTVDVEATVNPASDSGSE